MIYRESVKCSACGYIRLVAFSVAGDYDPPDEMRKSDDCEVCRSEPYKKLQAYVATLEEGLHRAQYVVGELGRSWSASTVTYDCEKIKRDILAVYNRWEPKKEVAA